MQTLEIIWELRAQMHTVPWRPVRCESRCQGCTVAYVYQRIRGHVRQGAERDWLRGSYFV